MAATLKRPLPVRAFNSFGEFLEHRNWHWWDLSVERIQKAARKNTRLQDFGGDDYLVPLDLLIRDFKEHGRLNTFGHLLVRLMLENFAQNRLLIADAIQRHPEHLQQPLNRPLYVIGLPRTGTTLLYNLLAQDPQARPLMVWETLYPVRSRRAEARGHNKTNRSKSKFVVGAINWVGPTLKQVHALEPEAPEEDGWLLNNTFVSSLFLISAPLPRYSEYFETLPHERWLEVYRYYQRILQLLQAGQTDRHWVLKSPAHLRPMGSLLEVVPSANVLYTHRDPVKVIPSSCSLAYATRCLSSDFVDPQAIGPEILKFLAGNMTNADQAQAQYSDRVADVLFDDLVKDPVSVVKRMYERFGYTYSPAFEDGMQKWLADNPQGKHGAHKYEPEQFGLTSAAIQQQFGDYWDRVQQRARAAS